MKNIATITKKEIISCDFPLHNILENSVFYPCSAMDGSVIKNLSKEYRSKYLKAIGWNHTASVLYEVFTRRRAGLFATMTNFGVLLPISNKIRKIGKWTK